MDILVMGFLYMIVNLFCPAEKGAQSKLNDMENGAAYFFSTAGLNKNDKYDPNQPTDYNDGGPDW